MTSDLQKLGGIAALIEAALYVTGFGLFLTVLDSSGHEGHVQQIAFVAANQVASYIAYLLIYVVFGVVLVVLALALQPIHISSQGQSIRINQKWGSIDDG